MTCAASSLFRIVLLMGACACVVGSVAADLPPGPVCHLTFDEGAAPIEGMTSRGVQSVPGRTGNAGRFTIADLSNIRLPGSNVSRDQGAMLVWVRLLRPSDARTFRTLLNVGGAQGVTLTLRDNRIFWLVLSPPLDWPAGGWHHVGVAWRPNSASAELPFRYDIALYVDGRAVATRTINQRPMPAGDITLGCYPVPEYGKPQLFELEGDLDDFALYDRWLSPAEVAGAADLSPQEAASASLPEPERVVVPRPYQGRRHGLTWPEGEGVSIGRGHPAQIILADDSTQSDRLAARELADYVKRMTGEELSTVAPGAAAEGVTRLVIGAGTARALGIDLPEDLAREELLISAEPGLVVLAGSEENGALYAVYELLERNGVRWYGPGEQGERVPEREAIFIPRGLQRDRPFSRMRFLQPAAPLMGMAAEINDWKRHNRCFVGGYSAAHRMIAPRMAEIMPESLFADHPEYFGMDVSGRRQPPSRNNLNPCTSNPDVVRIIQQEAVRLLGEHPEADYFGIEPIDGGGWCQCESCQALDAVPENYTDRVCTLANQIAEAVEAAFPGQHKGARFFAYQGYMYPPERVRLRDNVQVELTRAYPEMYEAWRGKCADFQRWDYNGWKTFKWGPMPLAGLAWKARLQEQYGFRGGWGDEEVASLLLMGQPFPYVVAKLMWDPGRDVNEILDDFFPGYYGAAAGPMRRCFDLLEDLAATSKSSYEDFVDHQNGIRFKPINYPPSVWDQLLAWVDEAERLVADDPWALRHVKIARMTYLFSDVGRDAQLAEDYMFEPDHPFWGYIASRHERNAARLYEAIKLTLELGVTEVRGNAEPATPEAMLAVWAPLLRVSVNPFRPLFGVPEENQAAAPPGEWRLAFQDEFEREALGDDWVVTDGDFRITGGHVTGRGSGLFLTRPLPGDQRVEFEAWVEDDQTPCDLDAMLGVSRLAKWRLGDGYLFQFGGWGNTVNALFKQKTRLASAPEPSIRPGVHHKLLCERSGRSLRWVIDGQTVAELQDAFTPLAGEYVGFYIDTAGQIDNVRVYTR